MDDLDHRLQAMGDLLDELSTDGRVMVELEEDDPRDATAWELPEDGAVRVRPRRRWLAVAAAVALVGGAGYVLGQRDAGPATTTTPPTVDVSTLDSLIGQCVAAARDGGDAVDLVAPGSSVITFPSDDVTRLRVLAHDSRLAITCVLDLQAGSVGPAVASMSLWQLGAPPGRSQIEHVISVGSGGPSGAYHVVVVGRAGAQVDGVTAEMTDGTELVGSARGGWFVAEGDVEGQDPIDADPADDDSAGADQVDVGRFEWTLRSGTVRSADPASIDGVTAAEHCAAVARCIEARLAELDETGRAAGRAQELLDARERFERDGPARGTMSGPAPGVDDIVATCATSAEHPQLVVLRGALLDSLCRAVIGELVVGGVVPPDACTIDDPAAFERLLPAGSHELTPVQFEQLCEFVPAAATPGD